MNEDQYYTFITPNPQIYKGDYDNYFMRASTYVATVIRLTNSLLLVILTCIIELEKAKPSSGMVGAYITYINKLVPELIVLIPSLKQVNKIVNLTKHSLIGINERTDEQGVIFFDLKTQQAVYVSKQECENNLSIIRNAVNQASSKLTEIQKSKKATST